jgi:hypothetical protein
MEDYMEISNDERVGYAKWFFAFSGQIYASLTCPSHIPIDVMRKRVNGWLRYMGWLAGVHRKDIAAVGVIVPAPVSIHAHCFVAVRDEEVLVKAMQEPSFFKFAQRHWRSIAKVEMVESSPSIAKYMAGPNNLMQKDAETFFYNAPLVTERVNQMPAEYFSPGYQPPISPELKSKILERLDECRQEASKKSARRWKSGRRALDQREFWEHFVSGARSLGIIS